MSSYKRTDRLSAVLQREIADLIQREITDPRLRGMITVSGVEISRDLAHAKIYISQLNVDPQTIQSNIKILNHAASYLRTRLGSRLTLRITPELRFIDDESAREVAHLTDLINKAIKDTDLPKSDKDG